MVKLPELWETVRLQAEPKQLASDTIIFTKQTCGLIFREANFVGLIRYLDAQCCRNTSAFVVSDDPVKAPKLGVCCASLSGGPYIPFRH